MRLFIYLTETNNFYSSIPNKTISLLMQYYFSNTVAKLNFFKYI